MEAGGGSKSGESEPAKLTRVLAAAGLSSPGCVVAFPATVGAIASGALSAVPLIAAALALASRVHGRKRVRSEGG